MAIETKPWYQSKILWMDVIWLIAYAIQCATGKIIYPEEQIVILGFINIILRLVTNKGLTLNKQ